MQFNITTAIDFFSFFRTINQITKQQTKSSEILMSELSVVKRLYKSAHSLIPEKCLKILDDMFKSV